MLTTVQSAMCGLIAIFIVVFIACDYRERAALKQGPNPHCTLIDQNTCMLFMSPDITLEQYGECVQFCYEQHTFPQPQ